MKAPEQVADGDSDFREVTVDWVVIQEWAAVELVDALARRVEQVQHRWPRADEAARLPTPCPACDRRSLVRYAPRTRGRRP